MNRYIKRIDKHPWLLVLGIVLLFIIIIPEKNLSYANTLIFLSSVCIGIPLLYVVPLIILLWSMYHYIKMVFYDGANDSDTNDVHENKDIKKHHMGYLFNSPVLLLLPLVGVITFLVGAMILNPLWIVSNCMGIWTLLFIFVGLLVLFYK